ncbi:ankyrin repeat domain-containing protein 6 isoform X2 [Esox lucius]|uniref:ankyrin repeat domain-containing protein 6 isoform X2 n=1 Tax=Esox lucius TaxID=8010 RepID=UPI0009732616|nr:ankyrin repeat domain-containing protein 6 isoform X2 [Esox lucius]
MSDREAPHAHIPLTSHGHQTALHQAAMVGNSDVIDGLIKGGCALDLQNKDGNTALHEVSWHGFCQSVKLLVEAGADVHARNKAGNTALHLACQNAHPHSARVLLLGGSSPDVKNNAGDTCLHVAARYNHLDLIKILVGALCSVSEKNQRGDTALHVAASLNHKKTVQLLLEAGTDGNARNSEGKTALDKARDYNYKDVSLLLAKAPQVHRFIRGRTVKKRRDRLKTERRTQSVTREEVLPSKVASCWDSGSMAEASQSGEGVSSRTSVNRAELDYHHHHLHYSKTSPTNTCPRRRQTPLNQAMEENHFRRGNGHPDLHTNSNWYLYDDGVPPPQHVKTYQLYTLYRDKEGTVKQAPANGCRCKPMIKRLEGELMITREEMRTQMQMVQVQVNARLGRMDRRSKQQAAVTQELKRWCMTQFHDADHHLPDDHQHYTLLPTPPAEQHAGVSECLPLLLSGDSSSSLTNYVQMSPCPSSSTTHNAPHSLEQGQGSGRRYFELKLDKSPVPLFTVDYQNTSVFPLPAHRHDPGHLLSSSATRWQHPELHHYQMAAALLRPDKDSCSRSVSSSQSPNSDWDQGLGNSHRSHGWHHRKHLRDRVRSRGLMGRPNDGTRSAEFFVGMPPKPTFSQEKDNLQATEVTQQFFETVSTQLERWYERRIQDSRRKAELRAQQERDQLLQRISSLEEELEQLQMTNKSHGTNVSKAS